MPTPDERQTIVNNACAMAQEISPAMQTAVLSKHMPTLLWNLECLANATPGAININEVVPGFGLLICKTPDRTPMPPGNGHEPISQEEQGALFEALGLLANALLPDEDEQVYQHFETADGLICALYRIRHQKVVLAAAGIDDDLAVNHLFLH